MAAGIEARGKEAKDVAATLARLPNASSVAFRGWLQIPHFARFNDQS